MKANVIVAPFARDEYAGMQFPARKTWASADRLYTIEMDGKSVDVLLDQPPQDGWQGRVEIVGKERGFWCSLGYRYLAVAV